MKNILTLLLLTILSVLISYGQSYKSLVGKADSLYESKNYKGSIAAYEEAFTLGGGTAEDLYNAACSASLAEEKDKAFDLLQKAFDKGWNNLRHIKQDEDLAALHDDKRWESLVTHMQKKIDEVEAEYDKPLQAELLQILNDDQQYRGMLDSTEKKFGHNSKQIQDLWQVINAKDSIDLEKVKGILDTKGWVGPSKVGPQASMALFLVIQHSRLPIQEKYLPMMREAVKKGNANASNLALLEDRVLLGLGKMQIYGSQIGYDQETKKYFVSPLEDPENVDRRRREVGLQPLADYVKHWGIVWNVEDYKKQHGDR